MGEIDNEAIVTKTEINRHMSSTGSLILFTAEFAEIAKTNHSNGEKLAALTLRPLPLQRVVQS